jgi:UDP-N-acetylglucosamine acyltransferase
MVTVHPTALVHDSAELGDDVSIGPYAIVHESTQIGDGVRLDGHTHVLPGSTIGEGTRLFAGAVVGNDPQDLLFDTGKSTRTIIGANCTLRENVTVHRATATDEATTVGDSCLLMVGAHVAHDCRVAERVILCNNCLLGGHVEVHRGAFLSGNTVVHQFVRVGEGVMLSGISGIGMDAPPYTMIAERSSIVGLNLVGMRRAGIDGTARVAIKKLYKVLLRAVDPAEREAALQDAPELAEIEVIRSFYAGVSKRGVCKA